jgi:hypothetical protein
LNREALVKQMVEAWGSPIVARKAAGRFSGDVISPRWLANADSQGIGPEGKFLVGRKVVYPARALAEWIVQKVKERAA